MRTKLISACLGLAFTSLALAQDAAVRVDAEVNYTSKYLWRGFELSSSPGIEPTVGIEYAGWRFESFAHADAPGNSDAVLNEYDFTLSTEFALGSWTLSPYAIYYTYPNTSDPDSQEVGLAASRVFGDWTLTLDAVMDVQTVRGGKFFTASVARSWEWADTWQDLAVGLGAANARTNVEYHGVHRAALNNLYLDYTFGRSLGGNVEANFGATVYLYPSADLRPPGGDSVAGTVWFGVSTAF